MDTNLKLINKHENIQAQVYKLKYTITNTNKIKQEIRSIMTRHDILHNYLLQKNKVAFKYKKLNINNKNIYFNYVHIHIQL